MKRKSRLLLLGLMLLLSGCLCAQESFVPPVAMDQVAAKKKKKNQLPRFKRGKYCFAVYNSDFQVRLKKKQRFHLKEVSPKEVENKWKRMLFNGEFDRLLADCQAIQQRQRLSDWAYLCLLDELCDGFLGRDSDESELLKAFLFSQSGYHLRLALADGHLRMFYGCQQCLGGGKPVRIGNVLYYTDGADGYATAYKEIELLPDLFSQSRLIRFDMDSTPLFDLKPCAPRTLVQENDSSRRVTVAVNHTLMRFYEQHPQVYLPGDEDSQWLLYANAPMSDDMKAQLYPQLRAWMEGKSLRESVAVLHEWVLYALPYREDDSVWHHARTFFPDEALCYPFTDCEDRAILFTRLVRDLLGLDCLLLRFSDHIAAAVAVEVVGQEQTVTYRGRTFLVCDPTFKGAPIGRLAPMHQGVPVVLIPLK